MPSESVPEITSATIASDPVSVWRVAPAKLASALNTALNRVSPARASLIADQLRGLLPSKSADRLIVLAAVQSNADQIKTRLSHSLIVIAVLPEVGDTATVLHVDWWDPQTHAPSSSTTPDPTAANSTVGLARALWKHLETTFLQAEVRFVQWASDPVPDTPETVPPSPADTPTAWAPAFGFSPMGTLEYLARDCDDTGDWTIQRSRSVSSNRLILQPIDPNSASQGERLERLVQRTYIDSLDCPALEKLRSVGEIIDGYRNDEAYAPELWFTAWNRDASGCDAVPMGCLLLARHAGLSIHDANQTNPAAVLELVYMGIVPEHRGNGLGQEMMNLLFEICERQGADRLILAVDQENHPAIAAYRRSGMHSIFRETVWGRLVGVSATEPSR